MQESALGSNYIYQWNKIRSLRPCTAIITRMRIQSVRSTKVELSVPSANANEVQATKVLTSENQEYIKQLREKFHNRIHKLDKMKLLLI